MTSDEFELLSKLANQKLKLQKIKSNISDLDDVVTFR